MLILRRRRFVINPRLQFSLLLTALGHVGLVVAVVSTSLFAPLVLALTRPGTPSAEASDAALSILYLHRAYWLPVLLALAAIALHSIATSHRIAGPVYRFRRVCESMAAGVVPGSVTLRKGDHLRPEMDVVNGMLATWRTVVLDAQQDAVRLDASLAAYRRAAAVLDAREDGGWSEIVAAAHRLQSTLGRLSCEVEAHDDHAGGARTGRRRR